MDSLYDISPSLVIAQAFMGVLIEYKAFAALILLMISAIVAIYPIFKKKYAIKHKEPVELGEALASGIFLGAAFFHMLPESVALLRQVKLAGPLPLPEIICVFGFLLLLFLERLSLKNGPNHAKNIVPYILALILIIHALTEGVALGISSTVAETLMLFIAIAVHKGSESFALSVAMLRHQLSIQRTLFIVILFSFMTPLGIAAGTITISELTLGRNTDLIAGAFNAFAAGTFLYISTLHHVHFHQHAQDKQSLFEFASLTAGVVAMAIVSIWT